MKPNDDKQQKSEKYSQLNDHRLQLNKKTKLIAATAIMLLIGLISAYAFLIHGSSPETDTFVLQTKSDQTQEDTETDNLGHTHTELDYTKLPLGDDLYSTSAKKGYVYTCNTSYSSSGAFEQGPWINASEKTWDLTRKISVSGDVNWPDAQWQAVINSSSRSISSSDLPLGHNTGEFPISSSDEAYQYDRNPNSIAKQSIDFTIPLNPTMLNQPQCIGGEVGIATTGVLIFNAFDAGGRDAVATEIQDSCQGHPQAGSYYHYHGYSSCFDDNSAESEHSDLLGYAFDGFVIYGLKGQDGKELSSNDLDECHGHAHTINWDGNQTQMYHYHMTQDFPYTVSCFRGEPSVKALSSGEGANAPSSQNQNNGPPPRL